MENLLKEKLVKIARRYTSTTDLAHEWGHVERVYKAAELITSTSGKKNLSAENRDALITAALLHDVGRNQPGDHAANSAVIITELFKTELAEVPNQEIVLYAIAHHSCGPEPQAGLNDKDIVLFLLIVSDHLDGLGAVGAYRGFEYFRAHNVPVVNPASPWAGNRRRVQAILSQPDLVTRDLLHVKASSMIECLLFNYCSTEEIVRPVRDFLNDAVNREIQAKLVTTKAIVLEITNNLLPP